ncbi:ribonuclease III domain-containing protein [Sparassis latifolia]
MATSTVTNIASGRIPLRPSLGPEGLPPLPEIYSDAIRRQIFTHRSYYARPTHIFEDAPYDPSPDNEMLEHLGDTVLSLVVINLMREVFPYLRVGPSTKIRALVVGNPTLASISVKYRLPVHLRMHPAQAITLRASLHIQADLFEAFVGGLYLDRGLEIVQSWLFPLLQPYIVEAYRIVRVQHGLPADPPRIDINTPSYDSSSSGGSSGPTSPTWSTPAPSRVTASIGHLSLFNQYMQQQGKAIEWVWVDSAGQGTLTTPIWVVRAIVEGDCVGRGRGSTKKAAKNEAAKVGLQSMGVCVSSSEIPGSLPTSSL